MDSLRVVLLVLGVVLIVLIYLWGMRKALRQRWEERRRRRAALRPENEPVLDEAELPPPPASGQGNHDPHAAERWVDADVEIRRIDRSPAAAAEPAPAPQPPPARPAAQAAAPPKTRPAPAGPEKVVLLTVVAPAGQLYRGADIRAATAELGLHLNRRHKVFHCLAEVEGEPDPEAEPVFGLGHLKEPGTFDPDELDELQTPGLLLFMRLPGPVEGVAALELMVSTAGQLAEKLGGLLCDERSNRMSNQAMAHLRSDVIEFERRRRLRSAEA